MRLRVKFTVAPAPIVKVACEKLRFAATCTDLLSPVKPPADALMVADPKLTPVTCAGVDGVVAPSGMKTVGETVRVFVSLLVRVMVTPPTGAIVTRLTPSGTVWPGATTTLDCSVMAPKATTVIGTEPLA